MENQPFVVRNHWFSSTYLGLLLRLEKGDIILVTLHQANWLHDVKIPYIFFFFFGDILWHLMGYILWQRWPCLENTTIFSWIKSQAMRTKPPWLRREFPSAMFEDTGGYAPSVFQHFPLEGILFGIVAKWMRA